MLFTYPSGLYVLTTIIVVIVIIKVYRKFTFFQEMASARAINQLLRRRTPILSGIPILPSICHSSITQSLAQNQRYSSQKSITKSDRNDSGGQLQTGFAEVGNFF